MSINKKIDNVGISYSGILYNNENEQIQCCHGWISQRQYQTKEEKIIQQISNYIYISKTGKNKPYYLGMHTYVGRL